jgi:verruculogen synthase
VTKLRQLGDSDLMMNILVAVIEFRDDNGATRFVPGSHQWDDERGVPTPEQAFSAALRPGDALLFDGSLWHGAGAINRMLFDKDFYCAYILATSLP